MAFAANEIARPAGVQVGRGGFMRDAKDTAYITDPDGTLVKSGERKGKPKWVKYGSPSGYGKQIENTYNLAKWNERQIILGLGMDQELAEKCATLSASNPEDQAFRDAADEVVALAKKVAKANLAADRGTHAHLLTEDHDAERDWISRALAGEDLGLSPEVQQSLINAWKTTLERDGLEILASEVACVDDGWRLAGTLDRIARCTKSLRFRLVTGEIVVIPAGTVLVLDIKSGKRRTDRDGTVMYWGGYAIQIAAYAKSVPYDLDTESRGAWEWPIDQTHALIAHLDVLGALDGNPSCELVYVDLVAGREHGGRCVFDARAWEDRNDVFSVGQLADELAEVARCFACGADLVPGQELGCSHCLPPLAPTLTPAEQKAQLATNPDEGGPADPAAIAILEGRYRVLDPAGNSFIRALVVEAQQAQVPFHLRGNHTLRRFEVLRGLVILATAGTDDDETLRCVLASVVGDVAHFANVRPGHVVGSLTAAEAALFALRCDELVTTTVQHTIEACGRLVLHFTDPAVTAA